MKFAKIMKEYGLQKNRTHLTRGVLQIMSSRIVWSRYLEPGESYTKTDNMCIYCLFLHKQSVNIYVLTSVLNIAHVLNKKMVVKKQIAQDIKTISIIAKH